MPEAKSLTASRSASLIAAPVLECGPSSGSSAPSKTTSSLVYWPTMDGQSGETSETHVPSAWRQIQPAPSCAARHSAVVVQGPGAMASAPASTPGDVGTHPPPTHANAPNLAQSALVEHCESALSTSAEQALARSHPTARATVLARLAAPIRIGKNGSWRRQRPQHPLA